jgi:hypothetical protein
MGTGHRAGAGEETHFDLDNGLEDGPLFGTWAASTAGHALRFDAIAAMSGRSSMPVC